MAEFEACEKTDLALFVSSMQDSAGLDESGLWGGLSAWV
jgi:hypothetical protein